MLGTGLGGAGTAEVKEVGPLFPGADSCPRGRGPRGLWEGFQEEGASKPIAGGDVAWNVSRELCCSGTKRCPLVLRSARPQPLSQPPP